MNILIVDNHWVTRVGLSHFLTGLDPDTAISEASTLEEACALAGGRKRFDLCLLDFRLENQEPIRVLRQLRKAAPKMPILIITSSGSRRLALEAVEEGASGFVLKTATSDELARALQRVCEGDIWLPAGLHDMQEGQTTGLSENGAEFHFSADNQAMSILTPRQRQVLELIAIGKRNADIGVTLGISPRTVQIHVSTILKLLKVNNRTEAALLAHRRN